MKKSFVAVPFRMAKVPGQVPSREGMEALRLAQARPPVFNPMMLLDHTNPVMQTYRIVDGLGMDPVKERNWTKFLDETLTPNTNEVTFRRSLFSKMNQERLDPAQRKAIFQRSLSFWNNRVQKSMVNVVTPDQLKKAGPFIGPRGGKWADAKHTIPWQEGKQTSLIPSKPKEQAPEKPKSGPPTEGAWSADEVLSGKGPYKPGDVMSPGHNSAENAYIVDDYPYGYSQRTQMRVWIESDPKKGQRMVTQTQNPKNDKWNKPKKSTYSDAIVMKMDEKGHVGAAHLSLSYGGGEAIQKFVKDYPKHIDAMPKEKAIQIRTIAKYHELKDRGQSHEEALKNSRKMFVQEMKSSGVLEEAKAKKEAAKQAKKEKKMQGPTGEPPKISPKVSSTVLDVGEINKFDSAQALKDHLKNAGGFDYFVGLEAKRVYSSLAKQAAAVNRPKLATQYKHLASLYVRLSGYGEANEGAVKAFNRFKAHAKKHGTDKESLDKSMIIWKPSDLIKADPRGGAYHKRVMGKGGKFRYYYDEETYKRSKDAHVNGEDASKDAINKCVSGMLDKAGGGCALKDMTNLVKKYGSKMVGSVLQAGCDGGSWQYKGGKLSKCGMKKSRFVIKTK